MAKQQNKTQGKNPSGLLMRVEATCIPRLAVAISTTTSATKDAANHAHEASKDKGKLRSGIYLHEMNLLRSPFERVQLISVPAVERLREDYRWQIFLRCCERIGAQAALALLPDKKRRAYLKRFSQGAFHWWNPTRIWDGLRPAIENLGLFPESAF